MEKYEITIGGNRYEIAFSEVDGIYCYELLRNNKLQSSTTASVINRDDIKMWISEKLIQTAVYDINNFVGKIDLK